MPGYKCPIKERMLYSSCKGPFISQLEQTLELNIEKKVGIFNFPIHDEVKNVKLKYVLVLTFSLLAGINSCLPL